MTDTSREDTSLDPEECTAPAILPAHTTDETARAGEARTLEDGLTQISTPSFVYALGRVEPRFPTLGLEKEFTQVTGRRGDEGMSDREFLRSALADRNNRYLARQLCWVFLVEGLETYILLPADPLDYELLIESVRDHPRRDDVDVVIGTRGAIAPPDMCNGLAVPVVVFDQIYSFDRNSLIDALPVPKSVAKAGVAQFRERAGETFDRIMQMADNAGALDDHRALNYLAVRYPRLYSVITDAYDRNASLTRVEVRSSPLSGARRVVDVIITTTDRQTDVADKQFIRVDVTEEYPFLMTQIAPYYEVS